MSVFPSGDENFCFGQVGYFHKLSLSNFVRAEVPEDWSTSHDPFWQRVTVVIEVLQSKDNIDEVENLLPMLFNLLSMWVWCNNSRSACMTKWHLELIFKLSRMCLPRTWVSFHGVVSSENTCKDIFDVDHYGFACIVIIISTVLSWYASD